MIKMVLVALFMLPAAAWCWSAQVELTEIDLPITDRIVLNFKFGAAQALSAMDEHGRRCSIQDGELQAFQREGETFYQLRGHSKINGLYCKNGMVFKINPVTRRFERHDHGFEQIFEIYAQSGCVVDPGSRPPTAAEARALRSCYLQPRPESLFRSLYERLRGQRPSAVSLSRLCVTDLLRDRGVTLSCSPAFLQLAEAALFRDILVVFAGDHVYQGGGLEASNFILHPDFDGQIRIKGHSLVFHLPRHRCADDIFRGCISISAPRDPSP